MQVYGLLERGAMQRATGTTKMNELSSRSHAVFIIIIEKSTVTSRHEADGDEMEQFRGLAPGVLLSLSTNCNPLECAACIMWNAGIYVNPREKCKRCMQNAWRAPSCMVRSRAVLRVV